jgi:hypothetical protein
MGQSSQGVITYKEGEQRALEYAMRVDEKNLVLSDYRGTAFVEQVPGGSRHYKWVSQSKVLRPENRYLMLFGTLLTFAGLFGFLVEYRLRKLG